MTIRTVLSIFSVSIGIGAVSAADLSMAEAEALYNKMCGDGKQVSEVAARSVTDRFAIAPQPINEVKQYLAVKVWFKLKSGKLVNPAKYKFAPKEEFKICFETAVPLNVSLYQNFGRPWWGTQPKTKLVFPDKQYPKTFEPVMPGKGGELPVWFEMDNSRQTEYMSICFIRSDAQREDFPDDVQSQVPANQNAGYIAAQGQRQEESAWRGIAESTGNAIVKSGAGGEDGAPAARFAISSCNGNAESSNSVTDVQTILFSPGKMTQFQFSLKKRAW
jgi:hypothetical protein